MPLKHDAFFSYPRDGILEQVEANRSQSHPKAWRTSMQMKQSYRNLALIAAAALFGAGTANAAVIAATNFDTADKTDNDTMTEIVWTGDDLVNVTASTSASYAMLDGDPLISPDGFMNDSGEFGATAFAPDRNIQNEGDWAATFTFDLNNGYIGTLTGISFDFQSLTNAGADQTATRDVLLFITVNGNAFDVSKLTPSASGTLTFTDTEALTTGTNTVVISTDFYTNTDGWNVGIDNLQFDGSIEVPEPGSLALLGLGGLLIARRRRG